MRDLLAQSWDPSAELLHITGDFLRRFHVCFLTDARAKYSIRSYGRSPRRAPPRERGLQFLAARAQSQNNRQAAIGLGIADSGFEITSIGLSKQSRIVHKQHELRWLKMFSTVNPSFGGSLSRSRSVGSVKKFQSPAFHHRRRICGEDRAHQSIQNAGSDACGRRLLNFANHSEKPIHVFARARGCDQDRRVIEKENLLSGFSNKFADRLSLAALRFNEVPLVQNNQRRFARFLDQSGDSFVLRSHAAGKIDNQDTQIGAPNTSFRPHNAEDFNRARELTAPANSSRIDEQKAAAIALVRDID